MDTSSEIVGVYNASGDRIGEKQLAGTVLSGAVDVGLLHQVVRWQLAGRRAGTHAVKTRAQVAGGGVKPWKQKGTGRARAGSNTSPVWVGGGVAHGPKPRDYSFDINRKQKRMGVVHALRNRAQAGAVSVIDTFGITAPKTKEAVGVLERIGVAEARRVLVVTDARDSALELSLRNVPNVELSSVENLDVYSLINSSDVVFVGEAFDRALTRLVA